MKYFVAVYTNECKDYCDEAFFRGLRALERQQDFSLNICDNSIDTQYADKLQKMMPDWFGRGFLLQHVIVDREPARTLFLRNVTESVNRLREIFLVSDSKCFVTIESDVIPPTNLWDLFDEVEGQADIIGGIYKIDWHGAAQWEASNTRLVDIPMALSGCTLYSRRLIEAVPFRWSMENIGAFPDAWMSRDAREYNPPFRVTDYNKIKCQHLSMANGSRGLENLR